MTPKWRETIRDAMEAPSRRDQKLSRFHVEKLAHARCFDLREVQPLCYQVSEELGLVVVDGPSTVIEGKAALHIDLGERVCVPAPATWIEYNNLAAFIVVGGILGDGPPRPLQSEIGGPLTHTMSFVIDYQGVDRPWLETVWRTVLFRIDGGVVEIINGADDADLGQEMRQFVCMGLAALAVINSPAAQHQPLDNHRGFVRNARQRGVRLDNGISHTKVTLGRRHGSARGVEVGGATHPKAYHFCRAHARIKNGKIERVRAHWRGDPAFGYRLPTYTVRENRAEVGALIQGGQA